LPDKSNKKIAQQSDVCWCVWRICICECAMQSEVESVCLPPVLPRKWSCDDSTAQGSPDSRAGAMTAAGQSWRINVAERERTSGTEQDRKCPLISTIFCWISGQHHRCSTFRGSHIYIRIFITTHMLPIPRLVLYFFWVLVSHLFASSPSVVRHRVRKRRGSATSSMNPWQLFCNYFYVVWPLIWSIDR